MNAGQGGARDQMGHRACMEQLGYAECCVDEREFSPQDAVEVKALRVVVNSSGMVAQVKRCVCRGVAMGRDLF